MDLQQLQEEWANKQSLYEYLINSMENDLVSNPQDLVKNLSLIFNIDFSLKVDFKKNIWIVSSCDVLSKDVTLKVFEYIYNNKYGLWSVDVENTFDNMSFQSYCRQMNGFEDLTYV